MKGQGYYLKSRYLEVRLIQCLLTSNKGLKEDFLIFSGGWHDGLPCPTKEGKPGGGLTVNHSTKPLLSLVNRVSLDKILRFKVYVNEADDHLRAAHLILGYTPISRVFQAPKCVIKDKDPQLHRISVAYEGFVVPEGIPIPESTPLTQPLFVATPSVGASSSQPVFQEEEEGKEEEEEEEKGSEGIVDLTDSLDEFEVFNQPPSPEDISEGMGIQRKP